MRREVMMAAVALSMVAGTSTAQASVRGDVRASANEACDRLVEKHGAPARGRDIARLGVVVSTGEREATVTELRAYRGTCARLARPIKLVRIAHPASKAMPLAPAPAGGAGGPWAALRQCESGAHGGYRADTGNGFAGAYQFTRSSWAAVGGSGNPAAASPAEQDMRAARLQRLQGWGAWPACSAKLGLG